MHACQKKQTTDAPALAVAASTEAQAELRELEERWEVAGETGRRALRPDLEGFVEKYPTDPSTVRARLLLARIAIAERRFGAAEELLAPVVNSNMGSAQDEAQVVWAEMDNRRGRHEEALVRLDTLKGKLLDQDTRDQFSRERILAALALRRWRQAIFSMVDWLSDEGGAVAENKAWVKDAVVRVPAGALSRLLLDWSETTEQESNAQKWMQRVIIEHLSGIALGTQDAVLAHDLLARSPPWLRASKQGDELALLAAMAQRDAQVSGRAVGLVVGGSTRSQRQRSLRVAAGFLRGLGVFEATDKHELRFFAMEDRGSLVAALNALSGLGASILVAGADAQSSKQALAFAETKKVPVIVMDDPVGVATQLSYGFVLGESEHSQRELMESADNGKMAWRFVGPGEPPCAGKAEMPSPFAAWRDSGVDAIGVFGDVSCVRRVFLALRVNGFQPFVAVGLEASRGPFPHAAGLSIFHTGSFPRAVLRRDDDYSNGEKSIAEGHSPPEPDPFDWYFSLGFDAAKLVRVALEELPESDATEKRAVRRRHRQARDELENARADLMTSQARGFAQDHHMPRELILESIP
jgi:hypothetical protein